MAAISVPFPDFVKLEEKVESNLASYFDSI
jgi:hypothetical protein